MNTIAQLKAEHVEILRACQNGEVLADSLLCGRHVLPEELISMVQYFDEYVSDRPSLRGDDDGRWWVRCLDQIARAYGNGCGDARRRWAETFKEYAAVLRAQIDEEARSPNPIAAASIRSKHGVAA